MVRNSIEDEIFTFANTIRGEAEYLMTTFDVRTWEATLAQAVSILANAQMLKRVLEEQVRKITK